MKAQIQYGLEGSFKVDLYSGNKFMETTDWFSNFITHTGLYYPSIYPFADCFRFLSIGTAGHSVANYGVSPGYAAPGTTGLGAPIQSFLVNNFSSPSQKGTYIDWRAYEVGAGGQDSPCGTLLTDQGLSLFRAWSIPSGDVGVTIGEPAGLQISEFMVSPSSGEDPTGCYAFSRVCRDLTIMNGWRAIISYQLRIKLIATGTGAGVSTITGGTFKTGNADVSNDLLLVSGWNRLSGYFRQVYPSLACVDSNGCTYIPKYGAVLEPSSVDLSKMAFYLSPDNAAFDVNGMKGGTQTNESAAYLSDGLMSSFFLHAVPLKYPGDVGFADKEDYEKAAAYLMPFEQRQEVSYPLLTDFPPNSIDIPQNIRLGMQDNNVATPLLSNYGLPLDDYVGSEFNYQISQRDDTLPVSFATPGYFGVDGSKVNFGQKAVFSTRVYRLPLYNGIDSTGRTKRVTRRTMFAPVSSLGTNSRFGSLVAASIPSTTDPFPTKVFYPVIDTLFYDSSGRSLMSHYRLVRGLALTERGTGVCDGYVTIYRQGENESTRVEGVKRFYRRPLLCGQITGGQLYNGEGFFDNNPQLAESGFLFDIGPYNNTTGDYTAALGTYASGWGAVVGVCGDDFVNYPIDVGLINHDIKQPNTMSAPISGSPIYWPDFQVGHNYVAVITGLKFTNNGSTVYSDNPSASIASLASSGFCRPIIRYIDHRENIGSTGSRLLPNHGFPNNSGIDVYPQISGGYYPGLSLDNGLDLYLDIMWSAPCGGAVGCWPPSDSMLFP